MKKVTVSIKVDAQFVNLLNASVQLGRLRDKDELTPIDQLALVFLGEARGALPEQVNAVILPCWKSNIEVMYDERKVEEI